MVICKNNGVPVQWANRSSSLSETDNVMLGAGGGRGRSGDRCFGDSTASTDVCRDLQLTMEETEVAEIGWDGWGVVLLMILPNKWLLGKEFCC